jgi:protein-S-isoprenylcysteine O-methyltransferase Ste14
MSHVGPPESEADAPEAPQPKTAAAWVGYLIFALILLLLIVIDAQAAYEREWANVTGITVFTLAFVIVPTGGLRWLRRAVQARKPPAGRGYRR